MRNQALSSAQASRYLQAQSTLQRGDRDTALRLAQALVLQAPASADAHHLHAMCLGFADPRAGQAFEQALALLPDSVLILGNYARWLRRQGRPEDAATQLSKLTMLEPAGAETWCELGLAQLEARRFQPAHESLSRALTLAPDLVRAWHGLGNTLRALGSPEHAVACYERALALDPRAAACEVNLGAVRRELGDSQSALMHYARAKALGMDAPELDDAINGTLADVGDVEAAIDGAKALVARAPGYAPGQETLLELLWEFGDEAGGEDPMQRFRQGAQAMPGHLPLQLAWLKALIQGGSTAEAQECGSRLLRLYPESPELAWLMADLEVLAGRLDAAGRLYARAMPVLGTRSSTFLNSYVRYLLRDGRPESAEQWSTRAVERDPANQESWALLSTAWRLLDDAREFWLCDYERFIGIIDLPDDGGRAWSIVALKALLDQRHTAGRAPTAQSVRGGSQTRGRLFGGPDPLLAAVADDLKAEVCRWAASLPADPRHPLLARATEQVRFSGSWSIRLRSSGKHVNHIHSQGWISSAFYVGLPPSVAHPADEHHDAGCLRFGMPLEALGLQLPARRVIRPRAGRLVLFPSYMWHGTVPFDDDVPRLTVAFDAVPARVSPGLPR